MTKNLDVVLFDVGGTLAGADNMFEIMAKSISDDRIDISTIENCFVNIKNKFDDQEFFNVQTLLRMTANDLSKSFNIDINPNEFVEIYRYTYTETVYLYDGIIEILEYLKRKNIEMVVVSDADADIIRPQLSRLNIDHYFKELIISSDVKAYKPSDKICKLLIEQFDVDNKNVIFVGDSSVDIATAEKIHADSIFVGAQTSRSASHTVSFIKEALVILKEYSDFPL